MMMGAGKGGSDGISGTIGFVLLEGGLADADGFAPHHLPIHVPQRRVPLLHGGESDKPIPLALARQPIGDHL